MPGRYFRYNAPEYARESQYVPLPFDRIQGAAASMQGQQDAAVKAEQDLLDPLKKIKALDSVTTSYGQQLPVEDKQELVNFNSYINNKITDLSQKYADKTDLNYKKEVQKLAGETQNFLNTKGANIQANYDTYAKMQEDLSKVKDPQIRQGRLIDYDKNVTNLYKNKSSASGVKLNQVPIGDAVDITTELKNTFGDLATQLDQSLSTYYPDYKNMGMVERSKIRKGVKPERIGETFDSLFDSGKAGVATLGAIRDEALRKDFYNLPFTLKDDKGVEKQVDPDTWVTSRYNEEKAKLRQAAIVKYTESDGGDKTNFTAWNEGKTQDELKQQSNLPVYETPSQDISGAYNPSVFDVRPAGKMVPYTREEADALLKGKVGASMEMTAAKIAGGKGVTKDITIAQPKDLPAREKELTMKLIESQHPELYKRINQGEKIKLGELAPIYETTKKIATILDKDIKVNSQAVPINRKEQEELNYQFFGDKTPTTENLGSGFGGNLKYYYDGKVHSYEDLKNDFGDKASVTISGKFKPNHPYAYLTKEEGNAEDFRSPKQMFINGKQVLASNPKRYEDSSTGSLDNEDQVNFERSVNANKLSESRYSIVPTKVEVDYPSLNKKIKLKTSFVPLNPEDRTQGVYGITLEDGSPIGDDGNTIFSTPEQAEQLLFQKLLSKTVKNAK